MQPTGNLEGGGVVAEGGRHGTLRSGHSMFSSLRPLGIWTGPVFRPGSFCDGFRRPITPKNLRLDIFESPDLSPWMCPEALDPTFDIDFAPGVRFRGPRGPKWTPGAQKRSLEEPTQTNEN